MRFRVRVSHPPSHVTLWSCDHVICKKAFIFTFARAQFFTIQGSFLLIYRQKLKSGKVTSSFSKWTNLWKKIFISRYEMIMFIYKSWSLNSSWLTRFVHAKLPSQSTLLTGNFLAKCHFFRKGILRIIRNSDSNKAHGMIWLKLWWK